MNYLQKVALSTQEDDALNKELAQRFKQNVESNKKKFDLKEIIDLGVNCQIKSWQFIKNQEIANIPENTIYFTSGKNEVYSLLKHLRNSSSHKERIFRLKGSEDFYYVFDQTDNQNITMAGKIKTERLIPFVQSVRNRYLGLTDINETSSERIELIGKIQL